ncbi:hypothetical protein BMT54_05320 [Pasteurellaceae bacterium 15-036681]|nr:hypothetical protein BMT54_05320 [Pasteurellaceae bacterium 15-036681]
MKSLVNSFFVVSALFVIAACSTKTSGWKRIADSEVDQKSYAIGYGAAAQTYADRVNESYDIDSFMHGVDDFFNKKVNLPVEQIRASTLNRMLDNDVYAYYSGTLYAAEFQQNVNRLSPTCWNSFVQTPSLTQGIHDAMLDLQKGKKRDDDYIAKGTEQIIHLCVERIEAEEQKAKPAKKK